MDLSERQVRRAAAGFGLATVVFSAPPALAPRWFARLFGFADVSAPTLSALVRSVAARDLAVGMGLWSAAAHGGNYAPWLLARTICDAGDAVAAALAIRAGARQPRFLALAGVAAGAAVAGAFLHRLARCAGGGRDLYSGRPKTGAEGKGSKEDGQ